jgi:L-lactate dehydrogenase complex protein LldG
MTTSRDAILQRIRSALAADPPASPPAVPEVWPREDPGQEAMAQRFQQELEAVHGEVIRAGAMAEARARLAELLEKENWATLAAMDRPLCRELTAELPPDHVVWPQPEWTPSSMADFPAGLIEADYLLADTGSSMIACGTPQERLLCYLPPACIVIGAAGRLREHMPAAWGEIAPRVADPGQRGEFAFITGPSRTADIEKILILGVHGPKRLIVMLVGQH